MECLLRSPGRVDGDVSFADPLAAQRNGWREVTASSACGPLRDSTVPEASRSDLLITYPTDLLSSPLDSSGFMSYGEPGPGKRITIYANPGHTRDERAAHWPKRCAVTVLRSTIGAIRSGSSGPSS